MRSSAETPRSANDHQVIDAFGPAIRLPWRIDSVLLAYSEEILGTSQKRTKQRRYGRLVAGCRHGQVKRVAVECQDLDRARIGIDQPVFAHPGSGIERALGEQIATAVRGTKHLNDEIGSALNTAGHDFGWSARNDGENVWLHGVGPREEDIDRHGAPPSSQILYERDEEANQRCNNNRMRGAG